MKRCKITVLRVEFYKDIVDEYITVPNWGPCPMMKEGDVFYTGGQFGSDMPEGFCVTAWWAIEKQCMALAWGGKVLGIDERHIVCCPDGVRPVIFKIEAVEDDREFRASRPVTK